MTEHKDEALLQHFISQKAAAAEPPADEEAPPEETTEKKDYVIVPADVGKTLDNLITEQEGGAPALRDEEVQLIDDIVTKGYGRQVHRIGKTDFELQSPPGKAVITSDEVAANYLKTRQLTVQGGNRLNKIHIVGLYLYRYGVLYPSWPREVQAAAGKRSEEEQRLRFEHDEGVRCRLEFSRDLDGQIIDYMASKIEIFQAQASRAMTVEAAENF